MIETDVTTLRVLIVDDEKPARQRLKKLLGPLTNAARIQILGEADDGPAALQFLSEHDVDIIFLDIQMPELSGFEVLEKIDVVQRPFVVFTTAYDAYALQAFEANAVDYLLKPISKDRLLESVARVERAFKASESRDNMDQRLAELLKWISNNVSRPADTPESVGTEHLRQISIPYRDRILIIPVERLLSAEIIDGITRLFILEEEETSKPRFRQHIVNYTLDQLEANLASSEFLRIHRSAIVQIKQIQEMIPWFSGRYKLILTGKHEVIASRERSKQLKDLLML